MSDRDSASVEAQIVRILRPDIGSVAASAAARDVIEYAIPVYPIRRVWAAPTKRRTVDHHGPGAVRAAVGVVRVPAL